MEASGVRIVLAAAMAAERARNPRQARRLILKQFAYIERFILDHPEQYALARSPAEARMLLKTTDKMVIIHSIEGGHHLLWSPEDALFWADQGVALMTLIHLRDKEFGGAFLLEGRQGAAINKQGARAKRQGQRRGLTDHGRQSIIALNQAGILVDYSHMSTASLQDALQVSRDHNIPPILTHNRLQKAHDGEFAITDADLIEIYRLGGVFSLGLSARKIQPERVLLEEAPELCWGTLEAWGWHHQLVQQTLLNNIDQIFTDAPVSLTEAHKTCLATGWSSDWNGWVSHSEPMYGRRRCHDLSEATLEIDTKGVAHPGLLPQHWQRLQEQGVDLDPMLRSAERFLQLWEQARGERDVTGPC